MRGFSAVRNVMVGVLVVVGAGACGSVSGATKDASSGSADAPAGGGSDAGIDAPPQACTTTTCTNNTLQVCGTNGMVTSTQSCLLGCFTDQSRCNEIAPSNVSASNLDQAAQQADVTLPDGTTINTDNGTVTGPSGAIAIATTIISQSNGPMLRVLMAKSFTIGNVRVTGSAALAIVSAGDITINGVLDLSADAQTKGPGALACTTTTGAGGNPPSGAFEREPAGNSGGYPTFLFVVPGGGGGGFGSVGGTGGMAATLPNGAAGTVNGSATLVPLRGGCPGGDSMGGPYGGAGGGAVQLVTNTTVHLVDAGATKGQIHVGGGGGHTGDLGHTDTSDTTVVHGSGGGGAGGGILIEAGTVVLDADTGLLAAGGGGAGWGACTPMANGTDAPASASTPSGGACTAGTNPASLGGDGATTASGGNGQDSTNEAAGGGGGGGLGRIRINTGDAQYSSQTSSVVRGVVTTGMAQTR